MGDRVAALRTAIEAEREPLVMLTHLLHLCRDEHRVLWERVNDPDAPGRVAGELAATLARVIPSCSVPTVVDEPVRRAIAAALRPDRGVPAVVAAHAMAQILDERYSHTFAASFRNRSPYQPGVGDPVPLDSPDLRTVTAMRSTSPPWRLANRLDETRHIRLAGEWAVQFRIVFDYGLGDILAGLVDADTVIATCHPNRDLLELDLSRVVGQRTFPIRPVDLVRQRTEIDTLIACAVAAGASIVVLPELCVTESLAFHLRDWVRRPNGPRLLVAGSYHHEDDSSPPRKRNTALAWVRGLDRPLTHDKHSPADRPVAENIQPQGWPELRVYVTRDGWHLVIAICRDLLNPQAVHALTEVGANLVLVPAMSETLMSFGGPAAHLVGAGQALVAVANNPARWSEDGDGVVHRPARALLGHPGLGQQIRLVHPPDDESGIALLTVRSAEVAWLPGARSSPQPRRGMKVPAASTAERPTWLRALTDGTRRTGLLEPGAPAPVSLKPAAVLVLLIDAASGLHLLLTERSADLEHYPGRLVFPGGATDPCDDGPVATALREAGEEVGLNPDTVEVIGLLPAFALPESGYLVQPVLAWSTEPAFSRSVNLAEVAAVHEVSLGELAARPHGGPSMVGGGDQTRRGRKPDLGALGSMTATVVDLLIGILVRAGHAPERLSPEQVSVTAEPTSHATYGNQQGGDA